MFSTFFSNHRLVAVSKLLLMILAVISWSNVARADAVVDWNAITEQAIATGAVPGPAQGILAYAMVHTAVHDAVQSIEKRFLPYQVSIPNASGSAAAAAAKAAHDVLLNLYPAQAAALAATYNDYLSRNGLAANNPGVAVGERAAAEFLALRAGDGRNPPNLPPFIGVNDPGAWRPTPSYLPGAPASLAPGATPWLGSMMTFTIRHPAQFRAVPPPALNSAQYTTDYEEVKTLGGLNNSARNEEDTSVAYFWAGNHPAIWNRGLRTIADTRITRISDSARLFALANLAMADAAITVWESKYHYNFWRPVTAIQEGDTDGNPATVADRTWQPLINNPNYPDYTSGANTVSGSMSRILELFFGRNRMTFTLTSDHPSADPRTRTYRRFSDAAEDVVEARILQGIHFRFADTAGREQGRLVADWVFRYFLVPVQ